MRRKASQEKKNRPKALFSISALTQIWPPINWSESETLLPRCSLSTYTVSQVEGPLDKKTVLNISRRRIKYTFQRQPKFLSSADVILQTSESSEQTDRLGAFYLHLYVLS